MRRKILLPAPDTAIFRMMQGKKPRIGGWLDIDDEIIKGMEPDLILTSTFVQNKITKKFRKSNMNVVSLMPTTLKGVFDSIEKIGKIIGREKEAITLLGSMKDKINEIKNKITTNNRPRVYIEERHKPPTVSGNWVPNLVKIAGGDYSLIKSGVHSKEVTTKQIQDYNPQIMVISICGMANKAPKEWITKRDGWQNLDAVKNGKVYVFDDSLLNRPGPRLTIGLEELARVIHPRCFD